MLCTFNLVYQRSKLDCIFQVLNVVESEQTENDITRDRKNSFNPAYCLRIVYNVKLYTFSRMLFVVVCFSGS
jgi:hypothetical protein